MSQGLEWIGVIAGSGVLGSAITKFADRKKGRADTAKVDAEAVKIVAEAVAILVAPLKKEIEELRSRVDTLEAENAMYRQFIILHHQDNLPPFLLPPA